MVSTMGSITAGPQSGRQRRTRILDATIVILNGLLMAQTAVGVTRVKRWRRAASRGQVPPRQVVQDGRDSSLGALTRPTRCIEVDQAGGHREPRAMQPVDVSPADRNRNRA